MCSRFAIKSVAAATLLGALLGGCSSDLYSDRRDTVTLHSGEAMAANRVTMTIDPWPAVSGNNRIAYDGEKAATAAERYRTGRVIRPVSATTSSANYSEPPPQQQQSNGQSTAAPPPGAPVK